MQIVSPPIQETIVEPTDDPDIPAIVYALPGAGLPMDVAWRYLEKRIQEVNPRLVIFDWLLGGDDAVELSGLQFAIDCKQKWPRMGAVVVTTGGEDEQETSLRQEHLDQQKREHHWPMDFAWAKPWAPGEQASRELCQVTGIDHPVMVRDLIEGSRRPSEH